MTKHLVYKTTNLVNGKYYIGVHSCNCKSCSYLGSGVALKAAIKKYGRDKFKRETIREFDTREEAFEYEESIVDVSDRDSYNLCEGGIGGVGKNTKSLVLQGIYYSSRQEAAEAYKVQPSAVSKWLKGSRTIKGSKGNHNKVSIIYRDKTFNSISELSKKLGLSRYAVYYRLNNPNFPDFNYC